MPYMQLIRDRKKVTKPLHNLSCCFWSIVKIVKITSFTSAPPPKKKYIILDLFCLFVILIFLPYLGQILTYSCFKFVKVDFLKRHNKRDKTTTKKNDFPDNYYSINTNMYLFRNTNPNGCCHQNQKLPNGLISRYLNFKSKSSL